MVKRISLQLRTKTTEAQPAVSDPPPTPPSSSQEYTQSDKAEPVAKGRPSRLKPTVPLHMTTRRHKSELESAVHTAPPDIQATKHESRTLEVQRSTTSTTASTFDKMPPKRINSAISGAQDSDEHMKKRLRGSQVPKTNGVSYSGPSSVLKEANDTPRADTVKPAPAVVKRPRGRPPLKPKPSLPTVERVDITASTVTAPCKESPLVPVQIATEPKSSTNSRAPSDIVRPKVPRQTLIEQYLRKQQLAMKHATTEQLRRRQARIQHQYNLLGQLAKKNNTALIDKSIEILNNVSDVDLARTEWATSILAGLEKAEEKRVEQIHFEQKIGLINAFHAYDAERQRIEEEYQQRASEIQEVYMQKSKDEIERFKWEHGLLELPNRPTESPPPEKCSTYLPRGTRNLDALAVLAQECEQQIHVEPEKTGAGFSV
ncbi:hypothetical protein EV426DRAFT_585240, partial [Tirmania nivea]